MNLQVQPLLLKVLATREVVMNKVDYSTYLTGTTKDELDRLDKLAGRYKILSSNMVIEALDNEKLWKISQSSYVKPLDVWEYLKECLHGKLSSFFTKFIEDTKEFSIVERKNGLRYWILSDKHWRKLFLERKGYLVKTHLHVGRSVLCDSFMEDGKLMIDVKMFNSEMEVKIHSTDAITTDKQGNIIRNFLCSLPTRNIKITKVMWTSKRMTT